MNTASMTTLRTSLGLVLALLAVITNSIAPALGAAAQPAPATWVMTGNLNVARSGHTATLLPNGKVLVTGGYGSDGCELYDPATGTWSLTGNMSTPRVLHTATLLSNGKVLVVGGNTPSAPGSGITNTAELYDPGTGTWTLTGSLHGASSWNTATLLQSGKVLVAGGFDSDNVRTAELYDPATGTWSLTGSLITARYGQSATLLPDGRVLVAGGSNDGDLTSTLSTAELYDPLAGAWNAASRLGTPVIIHTATLLQSGKILVAGGYIPAPLSINTAQVYDPLTDSWRYTGFLSARRDSHTATLLPNGEVLVAGGEAWSGQYPSIQHATLSSAESYDPSSGEWASASSLNTARSGHTATLLADGRVLVAGGSSGGAGSPTIYLASAELYGVALPGAIGPGFTGSWYDPAQSGHGLILEVLPGNRFYANWFAFNPSGTQQAWFTGVGSYSGNTATITDVELPTGGRWIPNFDPNQVVRNPWGTLTFTFSDCGHGRVDFNSVAGYGTGSMLLTRLTQPAGLSCP